MLALNVVSWLMLFASGCALGVALGIKDFRRSKTRVRLLTSPSGDTRVLSDQRHY